MVAETEMADNCERQRLNDGKQRQSRGGGAMATCERILQETIRSRKTMQEDDQRKDDD